ncbi:hypothetical protein HDU87_005467 [Geranomyces variabilis]|uniref:Carotenoid oxygenase n=1 Tax=Geranomyces variabilis TaxID=109894 RepID=A0AAD5XPT5_9FUNG|nr:hypothetical protein HDU87_005467 [Geranomyces variabilis]
MPPPALSLLRLAAPRSSLIPLLRKDASRAASSDASTTNFYLSGNFAPVHSEQVSIALAPAAVVGKIPSCLADGQFLRGGSNPRFARNDRPYHWFDGDGMVHSVRFVDCVPHYSNRYIRTNKYEVESAVFQDQPAGTGFGVNVSLDTLGSGKRIDMAKALIHLAFVRTLTGIKEDFLSTANTAMTYYNGRLLALMEGCPPVQIDPITLETVGVYDFDGTLNDDARAVTAHPKICSETGEMIFFGYKLDASPHLRYSVASADGELLVNGLAISQARPVMAHDFAITKNWSLFMDAPLLANVARPFLHGKPMIDFEASAPSRFGLIPRYSTNGTADVKWFQMAESGYAFHTANAWEEDDGRVVKLLACWADSVNLKEVDDSYRTDHPQLCEFTFHLSSGEMSKRRVSPECDVAAEFPQVDARGLCQSQPHVYAALYPTYPPVLTAKGSNGLLRFDTATGKVQQLRYATGVTGGEPIFVPESATAPLGTGYLVTMTHDEHSDECTLLIVSTETMQEVAKVTMPHRVPNGFHGIWLDQQQVAHQKSLPAIEATKNSPDLPAWTRFLLRHGTAFLGR